MTAENWLVELAWIVDKLSFCFCDNGYFTRLRFLSRVWVSQNRTGTGAQFIQTKFEIFLYVLEQL